MHVARWLLVFVLASVSGCGYHPLAERGDAPQRLWCGDTLCEWSVEGGQVAPAPTWHALDPAIRLSGARARLSRTETIPFSGAVCVTYTLYSTVQGQFSWRFQIDLANDGTIDLDRPLRGEQTVAHDFNPLEIPGRVVAGDPVRISLAKEVSDDAEIYPLQITFVPCPATRPVPGP